MANKKSTNKRRQRARDKRASGIKETGARSFTRTVGLVVVVIVAVAAIGGAVAFFVNDSKKLPQVSDGATRSIPSFSADIASTSAKIGTKVGNRMPDVSMRLNNGNTVSTGGLIGEGKPTFLFFFATW